MRNQLPFPIVLLLLISLLLIASPILAQAPVGRPEVYPDLYHDTSAPAYVYPDAAPTDSVRRIVRPRFPMVFQLPSVQVPASSVPRFSVSLMSASTTDAPSAENARAVASPMPDAAPVTMTACPWNSLVTGRPPAA